VAVVAGELAGHQLDATDLNDAVAVLRREARGFGVQYDLTHQAIIATAALGWLARRSAALPCLA
jgi:hypothetical protein